MCMTLSSDCSNPGISDSTSGSWNSSLEKFSSAKESAGGGNGGSGFTKLASTDVCVESPTKGPLMANEGTVLPCDEDAPLDWLMKEDGTPGKTLLSP